ncbi:hypothetical protein IAR50_006001 [Cryptococcus sp. DSM 104548]
MPPRSKRQRTATPEEEPEEEEEQQGASHLVSFLTGFADHHVDDDHNPNAHDDFSDDPDQYDEEPEEDPEEEEAEIDPDQDERHTPMSSRKTGLVGVATPRSGRGTPKKRKAPGSATPTPRKTPKRGPADGEAEGAAGEGIIKKSTADAYFALMKNSRTSGNSYSLLAEPLSARAYDKYISESSSVRGRISPPERSQHRFHRWFKELEAGFNLLFYGFGSKRPTLNLFAQQELVKRGHVVVINGTFPGLGVRDVVGEIEDRLGVPQVIAVPPSCSTPLERAAHRIYAYFLPPSAIPSSQEAEWPTASAPLYLVIHNIDAPSLRSPKSLAILSLLASCPRIHLIASYDHVHTPLIFSSSLFNNPPHTFSPDSWSGTPPPSRGFHWLNHSLTTYAPYDLELSYLRMSAQTLTPSTSGMGGGVSEEGTLQILKSVPPNSARLLKLLLTLQLSRLPSNPKWHVAHPASLSASAPPFAVEGELLKKQAKDKWIAREDERLEAFLGEYRDHGVVVEAAQGRGGEDGEEEGKEGRWLWVPLGKAAVERVLESMVGVE